MAVAIEDAGFEIRDNICWLYGSGFPKSLDVSKAIDKTNGEGDRRFKFTKWMRTTGMTARQIDNLTDTNMGGHYLTDKSQPAIPTAELWAVLRPHCGVVPAWVDELVARVEAEREVIGQGYRVDNKTSAVAISGATPEGHYDITAPATSEAQQWQGWGTALKPAFEPVVVGRKPIEGTVANNVLRWGVGGLNIDGSRIGSETRQNSPASYTDDSATRGKSNGGHSGGFNYSREAQVTTVQGRWPANVVLDEFTAGLLDEQSGVLKSGANKPHISKHDGSNSPASFSDYGPDRVVYRDYTAPADTGGASRFFYQAKASKRDRNEGLEDLDAGYSQRDNGFSDKISDTKTPRQNFHPTVKPTQLMRYLVKLVTPEGGTVLDPFTGSGSTGKAALLDGYGFIGAELTEEYLPIIEGRLRWAVENGDEETLF